MSRRGRHESFLTQSLPQWRVQRAGLPTPPDEDPPVTSAASVGWAGNGWKGLQGDGSEYTFMADAEDEGDAAPFFLAGRDGLMNRIRELGDDEDRTGQRTGLVDMFDCERKLWQAHCEESRMENEHLQHTIYMNVLRTGTTLRDMGPSDRSETRNLRQQLACMSEHCQSLTEKMAKLQEQTAEACRLLAQERQERLEERNNQLTVVVAKHGLERRMRNREQDLQAEWRKNAELSERCQRLEQDVQKARSEGSSHAYRHHLPFRGKAQSLPQQEPPMEDDWSDRPSHVPPEFGYSKLVRWKKRTREGHDHGVGQGKKQRRVESEMREMQLAGSESPPQMFDADRAGPGASAIDHMIAGEFTESETPSRVTTPLDH